LAPKKVGRKKAPSWLIQRQILHSKLKFQSSLRSDTKFLNACSLEFVPLDFATRGFLKKRSFCSICINKKSNAEDGDMDRLKIFKIILYLRPEKHFTFDKIKKMRYNVRLTIVVNSKDSTGALQAL
jgi:hypothetical protein